MKIHHEHALWNHFSSNESPKQNLPPYVHSGENSTGNLPSQKCGVSMSTMILSTGSPTSSCTLDSLLPEAQPCQPSHSHRATKLLVLFYSPTESLRPGTSSSAWNQDQQHEDDFLASWLTGSFSLHTHTFFPISFLLVSGHVLSGGIWFLKA